jgi:sodium/bile acid cotransporter 7
MAILLTTATNAAGVALIPLWLRAAFGHGSGSAAASIMGAGGARLRYLPMFLKLLLSCLLPTVVGKLAREFIPFARRLADGATSKQLLSMFSNFNLAMLIWMTISSAQPAVVALPTGGFLAAILVSLILHAVYLALNTAAVIALRLEPPEAACVVLMASQKSAPVAVTVVTYMGISPDAAGLLVLPCIIGQLVQLFVDQVRARAKVLARAFALLMLLCVLQTVYALNLQPSPSLFSSFAPPMGHTTPHAHTH